MTVSPLTPHDRQPEDQQHHENDDEDLEQDAGDVGVCSREAGKSEQGRDQRDDQENQRPFQDRHGRKSITGIFRRINERPGAQFQSVSDRFRRAPQRAIRTAR